MSTTKQSLEQRADELRRVVETPTEKEAAQAELRRVEAEIAARREAEAKAQAEQRMIGISRAYGSLSDQLDQDEARLREAVQAARAAVETMNERYGKLAGLKAEAAALADRFGVKPPAFKPVVVPVSRKIPFGLPGLVDHAHVRPVVERDEHGLRTRRTYQEINGSPGYEIIEAVGLKPWPALTPKQREIAAEREAVRERETGTMQRFAGEVQHEAAPPRTTLGSSGRI